MFDPIEGDDNETVDGENLEQIVSQLLQHQLKMQQIILNKQRRSIVRKKKFGSQYETSDTENEDSTFECRPPLPSSPPPPISSVTSLGFRGIDSSNSRGKGAPPDWSSGHSSLYSSVQSVNKKEEATTRFGSEPKERVGFRSNYDNLSDVWGGKHSPKAASQDKRGTPLGDSNETTKEGLHATNLTLLRVHSLSSSSLTPLIKDERNGNPKSLDPSTTSASDFPETETTSDHHHHRDGTAESEMRERPATIAVYEPSVGSQFEPLYIEENSTSSSVMQSSSSNAVSLGKFSRQLHFSVDDLMTVHPEHKIYSKASVNKGSIKKVLSKLTSPKGVFTSGGTSPNKTVSEPSSSMTNLYGSGEFDRTTGTRRGSGLVSSMARQCSRTLKDRIKQIRTEDLDIPKGPVPTPHAILSGLPSYKQGSPSMGARLAATASTELSDYAVPVIRQNPTTVRGELRPDSVLSSSSVWTSSSSSSSNSSSSNREAMSVLEETTLNPLPQESDDLSGDSFYEKSFEAIESFLDDEMFRDSAIYSEPEEGQEGAPCVRGSATLSPKHSFNYKHRSSFRVDRDTLLMSTVKSPELSVPAPRKCSIAEEILLSGKTLSICPEPSSRDSPTRCATSLQTSLVSPSRTNQGPKKIPPPVPAKPDSTRVQKFRSKGVLIQQQLRNLEGRVNREGPAEERGKINPIHPPLSKEPLSSGRGFEEQILPKGWVKHVVGKLQQ